MNLRARLADILRRTAKDNDTPDYHFDKLRASHRGLVKTTTPGQGQALSLRATKATARATHASPLRTATTTVGAILWRRQKLLAKVGLLAVAVVVAINLWVCGAARRYRFDQVADVPAKQAAIVLGALVYRDGSPSEILADRLETALDLYRAGQVRKILVSGDHGRKGYDEVNAMRRYLLDRGVAAQDLFMDHAGFDTHDTMFRAKQVFCVDSAVVVTQDFHLGRAVYLARSTGIDAVGVKADRYAYPKMWYYALRETAARVKSFYDVQLRVRPHYLGRQMPIEGDGRATWDGKTEQ